MYRYTGTCSIQYMTDVLLSSDRIPFQVTGGVIVLNTITVYSTGKGKPVSRSTDVNKESCSINTAEPGLSATGPDVCPERMIILLWQVLHRTLQKNPFPLSHRGLFIYRGISGSFMSSVAISLSHCGLIVEDFSFEAPQATLQVGAGL